VTNARRHAGSRDPQSDTENEANESGSTENSGSPRIEAVLPMQYFSVQRPDLQGHAPHDEEEAI
jgi:hypothetical protein